MVNIVRCFSRKRRLWKVLGSKYHGQLRLVVVKKDKGDISSDLGIVEDANVVLYLVGSSKLFDSLLYGTAKTSSSAPEVDARPKDKL